MIRSILSRPPATASRQTDPDVGNRVAIMACNMAAAGIVSLDTTIANVALPHMQGSFSATQDQMAWVLTSYIVASAVMTPLSGWLASRLGFKGMFLISIAGFTTASALCGMSTSLTEIVVFRFMQGLCGASLQPLGQAVMLTLYPPNRIGQVMAISSGPVFLAPILGPIVGGWLTDNFTWRWVFFINLPIGMAAFAGVWFAMTRGPRPQRRPFDFLGFSALAVFIVSFQLMLDRGSTLDWFSSPEIRIEAICAVIGLYVFVIQTLTGRHPFFDPKLALDRNFSTSITFSFSASLLLFSVLALQPSLMQDLMGYSVAGAGLLMAPRGIGTIIAMTTAGRMIGSLDTRLMILLGLGLLALSMLQMSHYDLSMDSGPFVTAGLLQGLGLGMLMIPLNTLAFATIGPNLRADAAVVFALIRNLGMSVGVSLSEVIFANRIAVAHGDLAATVQLSDPVLRAGLPPMMDMRTTSGLMALNDEISRRASIVGYIDVFRLGLLATFAILPLIFMLRPPRAAASVTEVVAE